jgi:Tol biopolymer transport system component
VLYAAPFDVGAPAIVREAVPVVEGVQRATTIGTAQFTVSQNGSLVYVPGPASIATSQFDLALLDLQGGVHPLKLRPAAYEQPRLSPDGTRVAVSSETANEAIVWIDDLSGTASMRRLTLVGRNRFPVWSPDGQFVAFQSDRDGDLAIFRQRADGTGAAERLTKPDPGTSHTPQSWSPDSRYLLFDAKTETRDTPANVRVGVAGTRTALMVLTLADNTAASFGGVKSDFGTSAAFSPDGRWVAYSESTRRTGTRIYVQPFPPTGATYEIATGNHPVWSADGKSLFMSPGPGLFRSYSVMTTSGFATGDPLPVRRGSLDVGTINPRPYDIGRNGKAIGLVEAGANASTPAPSAPQMHIVLNWFTELQQRVPTR